jgi:hypothetical protein
VSNFRAEVIYAAVERWLRPPVPRGDAELPAKVESLDQLRCGLPANNRTFRDVYAEWLKPLPRKAARPAELRAFLRDRLGLPGVLPRVPADKVGDQEKGGFAAEFWVLRPEPGVRLPAVLIGRKGADNTIVLVPGRDGNAVGRALQAGHRVLAFDPRGTGESAGGGRRLDNWGWFFGRPLPVQWALDIQQAAHFIGDRFPGTVVVLDAQDGFGWAALLAGAAQPAWIRTGEVTLRFHSLHELIRHHQDAALADVPGLLERLDVPQLQVLWPGAKVTVTGGK